MPHKGGSDPMTAVDRRLRFGPDLSQGQIHRELIRACTELGGEEGLRGYFKKLAERHPDQFVKLLIAVLAK